MKNWVILISLLISVSGYSTSYCNSSKAGEATIVKIPTPLDLFSESIDFDYKIKSKTNFTVHNPTVQLILEQDELCVNQSAMDLEGLPVGGIFSGTGVVNDQFDPAIAGAGTHIVTYTYSDNTGCENSATAEVYVLAVTNSRCGLVPNLDVILEGVNPQCNTANGNPDGKLYLTIEGGIPPYSLDWNTTNGSGIDPNAEDQSGLTEGVYSVVVTDAVGNTGEVEATLTSPSIISILASITHLSCNAANATPDGSIAITVSGGQGSSRQDYTYNWTTSSGSGVIASEPNQWSLSAGTYNLIVSDYNGCTQSASYTISEPIPVGITAYVTNVGCNNIDDTSGKIDITASGGTGFNEEDYFYSWSTDNGTGLVQSRADQSGLSAGTYCVDVADANGCYVSDCWTLSGSDLESLINITDIEVSNSICEENNGSITFDFNDLPEVEQIQFSFDGAVNWLTPVDDNVGSFTYTNLSAGQYNLWVRALDANCSLDLGVVIIDLLIPIDSFTNISICEDDLPFNWNGIIITESGTYQQTAFDANGCEYDEIVNLVVMANTPDEVIDVEINEADLPYLWNGVEIYEQGQYENIIPDANGCNFSQILNLVILNTTSTEELIAITKLYPNPAKDQFVLVSSEELELVMFDALGNQILTQKIKQGNNLVFTSGMSNGVYVVRLSDGKNTKTRKIVIQN